MVDKKLTRGDVKVKSSQYEKEKNNYERQREIMDQIDYNYYGQYRDKDRLKKFKLNYDLLNGRVNTKELYAQDEYCATIDGEEVKYSNYGITHYPIISQVAKSLLGQLQSAPFTLTVKDQGPLKSSFEEEKYKQLLRQYIELNVVQPIVQQIQQEALQSLGIEDFSEVPQEQQPALQQQLEQQIQAMTPEEIRDYIENDYKTPIAKQAQEIIDYLKDKFDINYQQQDGFKHAIVTGEEYYYVNVHNDELVFENVLPGSLSYGGSMETEWVQEMSWVKRETWLTLEDATQKYAEYLEKSHWEELYKYVEPMWGKSDKSRLEPHSRRTKIEMDSIARNIEQIEKKHGSINYKTKKGQRNYANAYQDIMRRYPGSNLADLGIRETHIVWRDKAKMYRVFRFEEGEIKKYWFSENYKSVKEDFDVVEVWVDQIWEGIKLGETDAIYCKIRPLPYQFKSIDSPYNLELPYIGKAYNTHKNQSKNVAPIDLGKPFQKEYDTEMAALKHDLKTNIGNVLVYLKDLKPENQSWTDTFAMMKDFNVMLADPHKRGSMQIDPSQLTKSVNMSKMQDIAARINLLSNFRQELYRSMSVNDVSLGQVGQYAGQANIMSQRQATNVQNFPLFETHRKIVEKACDRLMNVARLFYKDNPEKLNRILSPSSMSELKAGYAFWYSEMAVKLENSGVESQVVEMLKAKLEFFIQNGMGPSEVMELAMAKNRNDIQNLMKKYDKIVSEKQAAVQEARMQEIQAQTDREIQLQQQEQAFRQAMKERELQVSLERAVVQSSSFAQANDINADKIADSSYNKQLEIAFKDRELTEKMKLEREKLAKM